MKKLTSITKTIKTKEVKAPNPVKAKDATTKWEVFLGKGIYSSMNPIKGSDQDRIFSEDGTRCIRFSQSEMNCLDKCETVKNFHYHEETWEYDSVEDTLTIGNKLMRILYQPKNKS